MAKESIHKKLARVRKPRVHITYEVQVGDAIEEKELPYVVGVFADLSGQPKDALPKVKERKFVEIDRDNFNQAMAGMKPRLEFQVPNRLKNDESRIKVELEFQHLDDFGPEAVAQKVDSIRELVEGRARLNELALKINGSDKLEALLQDVVQNTDTLKQISAAAGQKAGDGGDSGSKK